MRCIPGILIAILAILTFTESMTVRSGSTSKDQELKDPIQLKVMSYNIRFGELASLEELAAYIASEDPDIVALQEIDVKTQRKRAPHQHGKDFITELGYRTGMLSAYGKTIQYAGGYYGVGILSKYPFAHTRRVMLPMPEGSSEQRCLLIADVELDDNRLFTFVSTHLDLTQAVRQVQVDSLNKVLMGNPFPIIIAGDFNAGPSSPEISMGMSDWLQVSAPGSTITADTAGRKIDYIFCYPKDKWEVISSATDRILLSDHLPVSAEIRGVF